MSKKDDSWKRPRDIHQMIEAKKEFFAAINRFSELGDWEFVEARIAELERRESTENDAVKLLRRKGYTVTSPSDRAKAFDRLITGKK